MCALYNWFEIPDDEQHELEQIALKQEWDEEQETKKEGDDCD